MLNKILVNDIETLRVLKVGEEKLLVIDCLKMTMPKWISKEEAKALRESDDEDLSRDLPKLTDIVGERLKEMHKRFASISRIVPRIEDEIEKAYEIKQAAAQYKTSEQTIRHRLCRYLVYQDIACLAPKPKKRRNLNADEQNFRWALNKFYYNSRKLSLRQAFKYLVKEKYTDVDGKIVDTCPKFHRFKYYYLKHKCESNVIISRLGRGEYDRNYRPLLGESVRDFCPSIGYGMVDSTICDIYLVNDSGEIIGRPIMTACIDAYSTLCLGYSLTWEGGIKSLRKLMNCIVSDKVNLCKRFGLDIKKEDWNCDKMPHKLITDLGKEYASEAFSQITDLGIELINLKPYRPELKSVVERFFGLIQSSFRKELIDKGVVLKDFGDRGATDYRKNACLTLEQFEKIVLLCIMHYNCKRIIELPSNRKDIKPHAIDLWNSSLSKFKDTLIKVDENILRLTLLPRTEAVFKRNGLIVNRLRYKAYGFTNDYLRGSKDIVAFDPDDAGKVWLIRDGNYIEFEVIDSNFESKSLAEAKATLLVSNNEEDKKEELESEIKLANDINLIGRSGSKGTAKIRNLRKNRSKEINRGRYKNE